MGLALVVAVVSAWFAVREFLMARKEHDEFMVTLRRRAEIGFLRLTVVRVNRVTEPVGSWMTMSLEFRNTGTKSATGVLVNVIVPERITSFSRCDQIGESQFGRSDHQEPAHHLSWIEDHVWRTHSQLSWFRCFVEDEVTTIPIRVEHHLRRSSGGFAGRAKAVWPRGDTRRASRRHRVRAQPPAQSPINRRLRDGMDRSRSPVRHARADGRTSRGRSTRSTADGASMRAATGTQRGRRRLVWEDARAAAPAHAS